MGIVVTLEADHICILSGYLQIVPTEPVAETSETYGERMFLGGGPLESPTSRMQEYEM